MFIEIELFLETTENREVKLFSEQTGVKNNHNIK